MMSMVYVMWYCVLSGKTLKWSEQDEEDLVESSGGGGHGDGGMAGAAHVVGWHGGMA